MNYFAVLIFMYSLPTKIKGAVYIDCRSKYAQIHSVEVTDCSDADEKCILKRGTKVRIDINFTSLDKFESMRNSVRGTIYGVTLPLLGVEKDACKTGLSCFGTKGQRYEFYSGTTVRKSYPTVDALVQILLVNEKNDKVVCVNIPCRI